MRPWLKVRGGGGEREMYYYSECGKVSNGTCRERVEHAFFC